MVKSKMRMLLLAGILALVAFGGAATPASADKLCARVDHTITTPELQRIGVWVSVEGTPICIPLP